MLRAKTSLLLAGGTLVLLAIGVYTLRTPFAAWRERRLIATTQAQYQQRDYRSASLGARALLQLDPNNVAACQILAGIAAEERSPLAIVWRQKLVQLQPGQAAPLLDLAITATDLGETFTAETALNQVPEAQRSTVAFHQAAAAWSMALQQYANAEQHFRQALALDPANGQLRLNLAMVRLATASPEASETLRTELLALQKDPALHHDATRALLAKARRRGDAASILTLAQDLHTSTGATISDHLLYLEQLQGAKPGDFPRELDALQRSASGAGSVYGIMAWMNSHGLAAKTVEWHSAQPPSIQSQLPEPLAVAEAQVQTGDWKGLRKLISDANWGALEFLRLGYDARLFDETTDHARGDDFTARWERAVNATAGSGNAIAMLARLVQSWGWKREAVQLWWIIASREIGQRPALAALYELAMADKNTRELYRVSRRLFEIEPASPVAKNNVAMFALLLGEDLPAANQLAAENFQLGPTQPVFVSTYAFSLYRQDRAREAADLLGKLPPEDLADPSMAASYGVVLASLGEMEKARPFLDLAQREKNRLFPEEAEMVAQALTGRPP